MSTPERVCLEHAVEFWTGLLAYARDCRRDPCVKHESLCRCRSCEELGTFYLRTIARAGARPSPRAEQPAQIGLTSEIRLAS